ncbi:MAG TPA: hypothetical protein VF124_02655, partial [Gaiellaceae bacterium]
MLPDDESRDERCGRLSYLGSEVVSLNDQHSGGLIDHNGLVVRIVESDPVDGSIVGDVLSAKTSNSQPSHARIVSADGG